MTVHTTPGANGKDICLHGFLSRLGDFSGNKEADRCHFPPLSPSINTATCGNQHGISIHYLTCLNCTPSPCVSVDLPLPPSPASALVLQVPCLTKAACKPCQHFISRQCTLQGLYPGGSSLSPPGEDAHTLLKMHTPPCMLYRAALGTPISAAAACPLWERTSAI